jgi:primosomal replication protein N
MRAAQRASGAVNELGLLAKLAARDALRWTPAGIPILSAIVTHESVQMEAGSPREVGLELSIRAAGVLAEQLSRIDLGAILFVEGFLAPRSRNARSLILHLTRFRLET